MKSKCVSEDLLKSSELINPFVHHLELTTTYEKLKTGILTVMVLPIRVAIIIGLLVSAWLLAVAGMIGLSQEDLLSKPLSGWRMKVKKMIAKIMCLTYQAGGIRLVVKGRQATRSEAPILVIAPHSTFLDAVIVYVTGSPTIIVRKESGNNPWLGKILNYTQPIFVTRDDPDSRHITVQQIINRVHSKENWSQVLIFPEATCTNRSCLITFKPGAFYPGLPVQPVLIRYPNKIDTVTWTWEGPGPLKLMWMTLVQPQSICEIEFLPVYRPSDEERKNPKLFASNVRSLMAKSLGVPTMDYTYDDCKLVSKAKKLSFSKQSPLLQAHQLRVTLGLSRNQIEEKLVERSPSLIKGPEKLVDLATFSTTLGLNPTDPLTKSLFMLYEKDDSGLLDFKEYLLSVVLVNKSQTRLDMIQQAFELNDGSLTKYDLTLILGLVVQMNDDEVDLVFRKIAGKTRRRVTYDDFESYAKTRPEFSPIFGKSPRRLSLPKDDEHKNK